MSNNFDPFGGGSFNSDYEEKDSSKKGGMINTILILLLIGFAIYYGANYLFLSKVDIKFDVKNTEGEVVLANIKLGTDKLVTDIKYNFNSSQTQKVNKKVYYYTVQATEYNPVQRIEINLKKQKELKTEPVTLEKNIELKINTIVFPENVYPGQQAKLSVYYKNTSKTKTYNFDDLVIEGDIKDWDYSFIDMYGETITEINMPPSSEDYFYINYIVKETKKETNEISVRVKYKSEEVLKKFKISQEPNVTVTGSLTTEINSGEAKNFTITLNNSRNKNPITDVTLFLDVNGINNENIIEWFTYSQGNIMLPASRNESQTITLQVPQFAKEDLLEGNLYIKSSSFKEDKTIPVKITIKEPNIDFTSKISKSQVVLKYDVNQDIINQEYLKITLENKSKVDIDIVDIKIIEIDPLRKDCNNFIYISQELLYNNKVYKNTTQEIPILITSKDNSLIGSLTNNIRMCNVLVEYKHPFREYENIGLTNNFSITVE